ncbi:hypothetical protein DOY81_003112 [Sarcophaga bullata]|nr:hypothetical protein DOY81_003112 [Sarcophaga bullata]
MSNEKLNHFPTLQNVSLASMWSFLYRKQLEIITIIFIITLTCVLISIHLRNPIPIVRGNTFSYRAKWLSSKLITAPLPNDSVNSQYGELKNILNCSDITLKRETALYGDYWLLKNYIRGLKSINMGCAESITYAINGDYKMMKNLPVLVKRWLAPISFAVYTTGPDYENTMTSILQLINCLPESTLIRDYVTFHIYLPQEGEPPFIALSEKEALDWSFICKQEKAPYLNTILTKSTEESTHPWYPISEGYNIARKAANTYFVLTSDIEFYPSLKLVPKLLQMLNQNPQLILNRTKPQVFALPVFELRQYADLPDTKEDLQDWFRTSQAMTFYEFVCPNCYSIPEQDKWLKAKDSSSMEVFTPVERNDKYSSWSPIYVSDNQEPFLMENLPGEMVISKRLQDFTMCLMDYEYQILHPAFLIHSPGASKVPYTAKKVRQTQHEKSQINALLNRQMKGKFKVFYGDREGCKI